MREVIGIQVKEVACVKITKGMGHPRVVAVFWPDPIDCWLCHLADVNMSRNPYHVLPIPPPSLVPLSKALSLSYFFACSNLGLGMGISRSVVFKIGLLHSLGARI